MKRALALGVLWVLLAASLGALELKSGIMKLVIDDSSGRISLYKLADIAKGRYEPLLFDVDPRTSYGTVSFGGKQSKLGDSADYRLTVEKTDSGAHLSFKSASCVIDEDFAFVTSVGAALPDGLKITYTLTNVSQKDADVGLRVLVDTWLGEKSGTHFRSELHPKLSGETLFDNGGPDLWISSPGDKAELMVVLSGSGVTKPDKVLLANWKRINDEPWIPETVAGRSFTLLPYSVNDSALALYWQPQNLAKGDKRSYTVILGNFNEAGFQTEKSQASDETTALFSKTVLGNPNASPSESLGIDLVTIKDLIAQIDQAVASGRPLSAEQIAAWRKILDSLEERKKAY